MSDNTKHEELQSYEEQWKQRQEKAKNEAYIRAYEQKQKDLAREDYVNAIKQQFPIGSVVQLKSGGPKMTVESIDDSSTIIKIHTVFYLDNRHITRECFTHEVLDPAPEKKKDPVGAVTISTYDNSINLRAKVTSQPCADNI